MKRIITRITMIALIVCAGAMFAYADEGVSSAVELNGTKLDAVGYDAEGTYYLPLRAVSEALGYQVTWSAKDHTILLAKADDKKLLHTDTFLMSEGNHDYYVDNRSFNGKTYLSSDFFSDSFGLKIVKDGTADAFKLESAGAKNSIVIESVKEVSNGDKIDITLNYPKLSGLSDQTVQNKINDIFKKEADSAKAMGLASIEDYPDGMDRQYETFLDYRIKYNSNGLLSVIFDNYLYTGGAHGSTLQKSHTFDLKTGKEYAMKDLFKAGADYAPVFNKQVKADIKARDLFELTSFSAIAADPAYYLDNNGVTVYFQQYEYFPYAAGIQTFTLDYTSLKELLDPALGLTKASGKTLEAGTVNVLNAGDTGKIVLKGNPTTGYTWQYTISDESVIKLTGETSVPDSDLIGAGSTFTYDIKGLKAGTAKITFKYYRVWEGDANPDKTVEYTIKVN